MEVVMGVMSRLTLKIGDLLIGECKLQKGVKVEIMFLQPKLESMQGAPKEITKVPSDQIDSQDKAWASEVRELCYDIEDSIDTFMGSDAAGPDGMRGFISRSIDLLNRLRIRRKVATDIRDIKRRVIEAGERRERYRIDVDKPAADDPRLLAHYKKATELVGIDEARGEVISILTQGDGVSNQHGKVVSTKVNPFGDAKPTEVVLQEIGKDWGRIDLELEHRVENSYERPHLMFPTGTEQDTIRDPTSESDEWVLDSGAWIHHTSNPRLLLDGGDFQEIAEDLPRGDDVLHILGRGSVQTDRFEIPCVCYVEGDVRNVISVQQLSRDHGLVTVFESTRCYVRNRANGKIVGWGRLRKGVYVLDSLLISQDTGGRGRHEGGRHDGGSGGGGGSGTRGHGGGRGDGGGGGAAGRHGGYGRESEVGGSGGGRSGGGGGSGTRGDEGGRGDGGGGGAAGDHGGHGRGSGGGGSGGGDKQIHDDSDDQLEEEEEDDDDEENEVEDNANELQQAHMFGPSQFCRNITTDCHGSNQCAMEQAVCRVTEEENRRPDLEESSEVQAKLFGLSRRDMPRDPSGNLHCKLPTRAFTTSSSEARSKEILLDSGASFHMTWNGTDLIPYPDNLRNHTEPPIRSFGGIGPGSIQVTRSGYIHSDKIFLHGVLLAPMAQANLVSVGQLTNQYWVGVEMDHEGFIIRNRSNGLKVGGGKMKYEGHHYVLEYFQPGGNLLGPCLVGKTFQRFLHSLPITSH